MTSFPDIFAALAAPFAPNEVKIKTVSGRQLHYITGRVAMNRLDSVLGPEGWWDDYEPWGDSGCKCRLSIRLPDGTVITKTGVGGVTEMHDPSDTDKTGESDSLKRAAVKFGIARYLYRDGVPDFVRSRVDGGGAPPPEPARNSNGHQAPPPQRQPQQPQQQSAPSGDGYGEPPRSGRALFAWVKNMEQKYDVGLLSYINKWGKLQDFPGRMVDWDEHQVRLAHEEACRKLDAVTGRGQGERVEYDTPPSMAVHPQDDPVPFDPSAAWSALRGKVGELAAVIHNTDAPDESQWWSAMATLDGIVGTENVVGDWQQCRNRQSFEAYYKAACWSLREARKDAQAIEAISSSGAN